MIIINCRAKYVCVYSTLVDSVILIISFLVSNMAVMTVPVQDLPCGPNAGLTYPKGILHSLMASFI